MKTKLIVPAIVAVVLSAAPLAHAALTANSTLSQAVNNGTLSTDIRDGSNVIIGSPSFNMSAVTVSTSQQTSTGTFGSATQRISVDNPGGANAGFSLALNATNPTTSLWTSGGNTYDFNGATPAAGQLTVDPSVSTWTPLTGTIASITKGTSATFTGGAGAASPITLATTSAALEDIWNGYATGIGLSQTIPANTPAGTYTISMTQTVAAL